MSDPELLRRYLNEKSEETFAELVGRHLPLVYSAALRRLSGRTHAAADVTQAVFVALARDAERLARHPVLTGWLYATTRNAVVDLMRTESRRRIREHQAYEMQKIARETEDPVDWEGLRPVLDAIVDQLGDKDRLAVLQRFLQGRPVPEIAAQLGLTEDAARKRIGRALDKLRTLLRERGIISSSAALATLLTTQASVATPVGLVASVTGAAMAGASTVASITFMSATKLSLSAAALLILGGSAGLIFEHRTNTGLRETQSLLQRQIEALAQENTELVKARDAAVKDAATATAALNSRPRAVTGSSGGNGPAVTNLSARVAAEKVRLHERYDAFLARFGLETSEKNRFVELKLAIADAQADLQGAVEQNGAQGNTKEVEELRSKLTGPMWDEIRRLLGSEGYSAYFDFEKMSAYRPLVTHLFPTALSEAQIDQLSRIIDGNKQLYREKPTDISNRVRIDWNAVARDAGNVLTPAQLDVLRAQAAREPIP